MAHYTMELHRAIEFMGGTIDFPGENGNDTIYPRVTGGRIPFDSYPIFSETYRARLNGLILDEYYLSEIAHETPEIFTQRFRKVMNLNMPLFNKLYESELIAVDPLVTVDMSTISELIAQEDTTTEADGTATSQGSTDKTSSTGATSNATGAGRVVNSDLPQQMLAGNADYASSATDSNTQNATESTGTATDTSETTGSSETRDTGKSETASQQDGTTHQKGYQGYGPELIARYRATLVNIDQQVIDALRPLFIGLWQSGSAYTGKGYYRGF